MTMVLLSLLVALGPSLPAVMATRAAGHPDTGVPQAERIRLVPAATGNEARYRVREQLAGVDFPNDAVGTTSAITGAIVIESGKVEPAESRIVVDLTGLKSDRDRRDGYLQRRTLETARHPTVTVVPREFRGFPARLPASGEFSFEVLADLTIRNVTRATVWQVTATAEGGAFTGQASTSFTFGDFSLDQPRVAVVLSVEDRIRLEYSFRLERGLSPGR